MAARSAAHHLPNLVTQQAQPRLAALHGQQAACLDPVAHRPPYALLQEPLECILFSMGFVSTLGAIIGCLVLPGPQLGLPQHSTGWLFLGATSLLAFAVQVRDGMVAQAGQQWPGGQGSTGRRGGGSAQCWVRLGCGLRLWLVSEGGPGLGWPAHSVAGMPACLL